MLVFFTYPRIEDKVPIGFRYNTKPVSEKLFRTIKRTYYFDFWKEASYNLIFKEFDINSKKYVTSDCKFEFVAIEKTNIVLKSKYFNFFSSVVSKNDSGKSMLASRLPVGEAMNTLEIIDSNDDLHHADVVITLQEGERTTMRLLRIYNEKEFNNLFNNENT